MSPPRHFCSHRIGAMLLLLTSSCTNPGAPADAGADGDADAGIVSEDGLATNEVLASLCRADDGDTATPWPVANEGTRCTTAGTEDSAAPLFDASLTLTEAALALHALCGRMDPTALTRDDVGDAALAADIQTWLRSLLQAPPLRRALAYLPDDDDARLAALSEVWLTGNALEHVLCGDLNPNGRVGGLHLWSEWYLAEQEGRANSHPSGANRPYIHDAEAS